MALMHIGDSDFNDSLDPYADPAPSDVAEWQAQRDQLDADADELSDWLDTLSPQDDPAYDAWVDAQELAGDVERDCAD